MNTIVFATHNSNKLLEIQALIPKDVMLLSLSDIGCTEEIPETQMTIEGNALQKANFIKNHYQKDCFADDTGLEVMALNGEPGVHSARYAGPEKNDTKNIHKLLKSLEGKSNRLAQFKTVIALHYKQKTITFEGICKGEITKTPSGIKGFGYDSIFKPKGSSKTFAEMSLEEKNAIGHRGIAVSKLITFLKAQN